MVPQETSLIMHDYRELVVVLQVLAEIKGEIFISMVSTYFMVALFMHTLS